MDSKYLLRIFHENGDLASKENLLARFNIYLSLYDVKRETDMCDVSLKDIFQAY
jgi:hypothetical protein